MRAILIGFLRRNPRLLHHARTVRSELLGRLPQSKKRPRDVPAPASWARARQGIAVPHDTVFHNVPIVPARRFTYGNAISDGGPVWPDFDNQPLVRHQVHDRFVDENARPWRRSGPLVETPLIWGGRCFHHFGYLAAEHLNRLPGALYHQPEARVVFTLQPGKLVRDVPTYFWEMAAWLGLPPHQILFVTRPFIAARLHVSPQTEHMSALGPPVWYLELLEERLKLNELAPVRAAAAYVHRLGQLAAGNGAVAGDAALVEAMRRAGVAIMDPARESLARQLAVYAGAQLLIFAEGSALHGRQLLGRIDQKILVLCRRPGSTMAWAQIGPRCRELEFASTLRSFAAPVATDGSVLLPHGIGFVDPPAMLHLFARHGIELAQHWDSRAFEQAQREDIAAWTAAISRRHDVDQKATRQALALALGAADLRYEM